ncbi:TetR/AcrR family transcriptional regulator C-terminal domain-containing protein [Saccharopolyspora shandongensis]|uniref:TetR/AcrR family transcriptional regulator C-terminal domain-containing protein n=1 Tax=Saccharopolyspora shandongensis TaxID=418495 RepID=UPI00342DEA84
MEKAGLEGPQLVAAVGSLTYYVQGYAAAENVWRSTHRDPAGVAELRSQAQRHIDRQAKHYPALTRHAQLTDDDLDASFELGLDTILDGIEARLGT